MASMGSLAHYMQELSHDGFDLADFLHEGSGPMWAVALHQDPSLVAGWILIEEAAEGGDRLLSTIAKAVAGIPEGYDGCAKAERALYRRRTRRVVSTAYEIIRKTSS